MYVPGSISATWGTVALTPLAPYMHVSGKGPSGDERQVCHLWLNGELLPSTYNTSRSQTKNFYRV